MDGYCSIKDSNLAHYFSRPDVYSHLMRMGLVTVDGRVVTDIEWRQEQAATDRRIRHLSNVEEGIDEGGLVKYYQNHKTLLTGPGRLRGQPKRHSVAFILSDGEKVKGGTRKKRRKLPDFPIKIPKENFCPIRWQGRLGIAGEPYLSALPPSSRSSTPFSCSSAASRGCVFERLYPEPPDDASVSYKARKSKFPPAVLTLQYLGPSRPTEVSLFQQPCGTYTIPIFTSIISTGDHVEVTSHRKEGFRFSMVICEDGVAISRLSSCCEHRYTSGRRLGGPSGHLRVITISDGSPCSKCIERVETAKMKGRYLSSKKAVGNKRRPPSRHPLLLKKNNDNYGNDECSDEEASDTDEATDQSESSCVSQDEEVKMTDSMNDSDSSRSSGNKTYYHSRGSDDDSQDYRNDYDSQDLGSDNECSNGSSSTSGHSSSNSTSKSQYSKANSDIKCKKKCNSNTDSSTLRSKHTDKSKHNDSNHIKSSTKTNSNQRRQKYTDSGSEGNNNKTSDGESGDTGDTTSCSNEDTEDDHSYNNSSFVDSSSDLTALSEGSQIDNKNYSTNESTSQQQRTTKKKLKVKISP